MIFHEIPQQTGLDLTLAVQRHGADELLPYKVAAGQQLFLACFYPKGSGSQRGRSVIVLIHGGGWRSRKTFDDQVHWSGDYLGFLARLYADRGYIAVSVDYRLLPDGSFADMIQDCQDAVAYAVQCFKPKTLELLGESAGGYLAAAVDVFSDEIQFQRVILANPITDLTMDHWGDALPSEADRRANSPGLYVGRQCSPTLLIHGAADRTVSPEHSLRYHAALQNVGIPCDLLLLDDTQHAFLLAEYYKDTRACETALRWINTQIEQSTNEKMNSQIRDTTE